MRVTLSRIHPSLHLSFSPGLVWGGTSEALRADMRGPGACLPEQPGQDSWTRTAELLGVLPLDPPWASPGSRGCCGAVGCGRVAWEQVLAKGPGWASCTSGPGDLDPSSLELGLRMRVR